MKKLALLVICCCLLVAAASPKLAPTWTKTRKATPNGGHYGIVVGADNAVTTTVSKYISQSGLSFSPLTLTISGSQAPYAELNVSSGSTQTLSDAIGVVTAANVQMLYISTDSLDVTLSCGTTSAFGTSAGTKAILQGVPYEWDTSSGSLGLTDWNSFSITAGTSGTTSGGTAASTAVHIRSSLSQ